MASVETRLPSTTLVTGANRGLGIEVCRQLARLGSRVFLTARDVGHQRLPPAHPGQSRGSDRQRHQRGGVVQRGQGLAHQGDHLAGYAVAKAAQNAYTVKLASALADRPTLVNAISPGFVATQPGAEEMGARPIPEGAASIVSGATLPDGGPTGGFFRDGEPLTWEPRLPNHSDLVNFRGSLTRESSRVRAWVRW